MIRTVVCEKDGCSGNKFLIETESGYLKLTCDNCGSKYELGTKWYEFVILSNCSCCNNNTFKVFKDTESENVYIKCTKCGEAPDKIYVDEDGVQISYEGKILSDIKEAISLMERRMSSLEGKLQGLEAGQNVLEESLAYINRYLVEKN
mgnify:FL=1